MEIQPPNAKKLSRETGRLGATKLREAVVIYVVVKPFGSVHIWSCTHTQSVFGQDAAILHLLVNPQEKRKQAAKNSTLSTAISMALPKQQGSEQGSIFPNLVNKRESLLLEPTSWI